jgi:SAM-dependent methyltransferase/uncharacterized protein YbaR (Trm112 family)
VDLIRCPACGGRLVLRVVAAEGAEEVATAAVAAPACAEFCSLHERPVDAAFRPDCGACYARDVREGLLACTECPLYYPLIDGVPRLIRNARQEYAAELARLEGAAASADAAAERLGEVDASVFDKRSNESFGLQWREYQYDDKTWFKDDVALRQGEFLQSIDAAAEQLRGATVLDAGCGNGKLTATIAAYGAEVVGMDLSRSVERANVNRASLAGSRALFVHFVQGNVMEPPFRRGAFDYVHSSGVLHHTPDTERAFRSILPLARHPGKVYVQLYRRREPWVGVPNRLLRAFTSRLPPGLLYYLCYAAVPAHTAAVRLVARLRGERTRIHEASRRERAISLFDNYSPRYQYRYTPEEVRAMFERARLRNVRDVTLANEARHMVAFVGETVANGAKG